MDRAVCRFGKQCHQRDCMASHSKERNLDLLPEKNHEKRRKRALHKQKAIATNKISKMSPRSRLHTSPYSEVVPRKTTKPVNTRLVASAIVLSLHTTKNTADKLAAPESNTQEIPEIRENEDTERKASVNTDQTCVSDSFFSRDWWQAEEVIGPERELPDFIKEIVTFVSPIVLSSLTLSIFLREMIDLDALHIIATQDIFYTSLFYEAKVPLSDVVQLVSVFGL